MVNNLSNGKFERLAIIDGARTPFVKAGGVFKDIQADDLGTIVFRNLLSRLNFNKELFDEVIVGNVSNPAHAANIARVIALKSGFDIKTPAYTVSRNCASGMEAVINAFVRVNAGVGDVYGVMGVESMSNIPLLFNKEMTNFFANLFKSKTISQKLKTLLTFRLRFLSPIIAVQLGLTDPTCGLIMGLTAENIAKDFAITREEQDKFALRSHNLAENAIKNNLHKDEIISICYNKEKAKFAEFDDGVRLGQTIDALQKLKPFFLKPFGTVTVGNSSQITDGAVGLITMSEKKAKELGLKPLGFIKSFATEGCDQTKMGLGPVFAINSLLKKNKLSLQDIDLFEINEAFSAQVIGCLRAMESNEFCKKHFDSNAIGSIDIDKVNINGGAISIGHPVGASGARIILHALHQLKAKQKQSAIATLCIGGGQGSAVLIEKE